jgi:hypothetical protein
MSFKEGYCWLLEFIKIKIQNKNFSDEGTLRNNKEAKHFDIFLSAAHIQKLLLFHRSLQNFNHHFNITLKEQQSYKNKTDLP